MARISKHEKHNVGICKQICKQYATHCWDMQAIDKDVNSKESFKQTVILKNSPRFVIKQM